MSAITRLRKRNEKKKTYWALFPRHTLSSTRRRRRRRVIKLTEKPWPDGLALAFQTCTGAALLV